MGILSDFPELPFWGGSWRGGEEEEEEGVDGGQGIGRC